MQLQLHVFSLVIWQISPQTSGISLCVLNFDRTHHGIVSGRGGHSMPEVCQGLREVKAEGSAFEKLGP